MNSIKFKISAKLKTFQDSDCYSTLNEYEVYEDINFDDFIVYNVNTGCENLFNSVEDINKYFKSEKFVSFSLTRIDA